MVHLSFYPVGESFLLVIAAGLVLLALLGLGPARHKTPRGRRMTLAAIRLAIIVLVLLAMLRPTLVYTETRKQPATLVVLADWTRSMSVPDAIGGKTRWDVLRRALADAAPALAELAKDFEVKVYAFDSEAHAVSIADGKVRLPETPPGTQTAIGAVLEDVLRFEAGKRLLGVVLLSDGAQRAMAPRDSPPQTPAASMKQMGFPLFTFPIGQSRGLGQARDVAVKELLVSEQVYVRNDLEILAQVRVDGYVNQDLPVRLLFETGPGKMEVVAEQKIRATADGQLIPVKFSYAPPVAGEFKLTVEAVSQPGELVTTNNQLSTFVTVLKGGLKVLYVEGNLRIEQKWIRRSLNASPDINFQYQRLEVRDPSPHPARLSELFKPGKFEVYILGDVDSRAFRPGELEDLARAVSQGAGLMMLGGLSSFGPGGYGTSPLEDVLPIVMDRLERQNPDEPARSDLHVPGPLQMLPTPLGARHFTMMLASSARESQALWEKLPPLLGANRFTHLKRGAEELAAAGDHPLLVAQQYGNGRVIAFAGDTTGQWWMQGFEAAHKRFWRQIVLWLARKDQAMEGDVWVKLQDRRLAPGQRLDFTVGARSSHGEPVSDLSATAEVVFPDGTTRRPVQLIGQDHALAGSFRDTLAAGDYVVEVTARQREQVLGTARARFLVHQQDLELDNASADTALLESLAAMTGGQSEAPERLSAVIRRLASLGTQMEVQQETKKTFWDTWPYFLLLVTLLTVEWYLRKRWGLV
jgi:hypothetical protein